MRWIFQKVLFYILVLVGLNHPVFRRFGFKKNIPNVVKHILAKKILIFVKNTFHISLKRFELVNRSV